MFVELDKYDVEEGTTPIIINTDFITHVYPWNANTFSGAFISFSGGACCVVTNSYLQVSQLLEQVERGEKNSWCLNTNN